MASLTCPNCGKDNPDFLDNCQFCQTALRREATLNIGEGPTKKVTAELEAVLPDWLRDARQQGRDSAEEEAKKEATKPRVQKEEPPDLLAGLAFQAASDEEEVPDWLAAINPVIEKKTPASAKPAEDAPVDFFAQFNQPAQESAMPPLAEISQNNVPVDDAQKDELSSWFSQASEQPDEPFRFDAEVSPNESVVSNDFSAPISQQPAAPEDLGWLHDLEASAKQPAPSAASQADLGWAPTVDSSLNSQDDLGWLNNLGGTPAPTFNEPAPEQPASSQEDLSWLNNLAGTPAPSFDTPVSSQPASSQEDLNWLNNLGNTPASSFDAPVSAQPAQEDLNWLNNLAGTPAPSFDTPVSSQPTSLQEDLGWLNNTPAPSFDIPASSEPTTSQEDLSWLDNLSNTSTPELNGPAPAQTISSQEDLDWLNNLGNMSAPLFNEPAPAQPASSQEDLGWLNNLSGTPAPTFDEPAPVQPTASQEDLSWLNNLAGTPAPASDVPPPFAKTGQLKNPDNVPTTPPSPFTPRRTAPLSEDAALDSTPDWLKSAMTESAMPPLGATSMDWFTSKDQPVDDAQSTPDQTQGLLASIDQNIPASASVSSSLSNQDVDSLFAVNMPDWLSQPEASAGVTSAQGNISSEIDDSLAPVNLPSWVQAMRPVESVISEASPATADLNTEKEGPLAGLRGVIPFAPIGSAQRPKAISLKLQASEEQQTSASLLDQILAGETTAHPLKAVPFVASQRTLRWVLSALFIVVLGAMIFQGTRILPVSAALPIEVSNASNVVAAMKENVQVLVVVDYEAALSGEMEAVTSPLLDQMTALHHPKITFVSTSPNGSALVERLMTDLKLNSGYINIGYLPGGSAGVRGFTEQPKTVMPLVNVNQFSEFANVIIVTDHAESGLVWIEQLELMKKTDPTLAKQPLLFVASAQAGPLLQPYVSSKQVTGMLSGLSDAARYEYAVNNSQPGIARSYWDAFGVGLFMAIISIVLGSLWSLFTGIRARRAEAGQG